MNRPQEIHIGRTNGKGFPKGRRGGGGGEKRKEKKKKRRKERKKKKKKKRKKKKEKGRRGERKGGGGGGGGGKKEMKKQVRRVVLLGGKQRASQCEKKRKKARKVKNRGLGAIQERGESVPWKRNHLPYKQPLSHNITFLGNCYKVRRHLSPRTHKKPSATIRCVLRDTTTLLGQAKHGAQ